MIFLSLRRFWNHVVSEKITCDGENRPERQVSQRKAPRDKSGKFLSRFKGRKCTRLSATHRPSTNPAARRRLLPDAGTVGAATSWRLAPRQAHGEHRAFALLARHGHVTAHHTRELAGDGKAEPRAAEALSGRSI